VALVPLHDEATAGDLNRVQIPYLPRKQFLPFHQREQRFAAMVCHRRAGKTVACINELVARAVHSKKKRPRYGYIGPMLKQSKKIAWEYLKEYTAGLVDKVSESELYVRLKHNGAEICIYGADNPDSFRGLYFDGIVLDEYGDMSPSVWGKVLVPTLSDRRGWAVFIGTFKGKNHFYRIHRRSQGLDLPPGEDPVEWRKRWFSFLLKASESGILPASELAIAKAEQDEEEYQQEYECNPNAAVKGTYYAKIISNLELKGQIYSKFAEWDPDLPVNVFSDLGLSDSTTLIFTQEHSDGHAFIDCFEDHGQKLSYYFDKMEEKPYAYGNIWLPHDARAGTLQTGVATVQLAIEESRRLRKWDKTSDHLINISPKLDVQDGINAVRKMLPACYFSDKCEDLVEALRAYKRKWDEDNAVFMNKPDHDWSSHFADAFRYWALSVRAIKVEEKPAQIEERRIMTLPAPKITLEGLYAARPNRRFGERM
jgi:phage terminase large subunit